MSIEMFDIAKPFIRTARWFAYFATGSRIEATASPLTDVIKGEGEDDDLTRACSTRQWYYRCSTIMGRGPGLRGGRSSGGHR